MSAGGGGGVSDFLCLANTVPGLHTLLVYV